MPFGGQLIVRGGEAGRPGHWWPPPPGQGLGTRVPRRLQEADGRHRDGGGERAVVARCWMAARGLQTTAGPVCGFAPGSGAAQPAPGRVTSAGWPLPGGSGSRKPRVHVRLGQARAHVTLGGFLSSHHGWPGPRAEQAGGAGRPERPWVAAVSGSLPAPLPPLQGQLHSRWGPVPPLPRPQGVLGGSRGWGPGHPGGRRFEQPALAPLGWSGGRRPPAWLVPGHGFLSTGAADGAGWRGPAHHRHRGSLRRLRGGPCECPCPEPSGVPWPCPHCWSWHWG